MTLPAQLLKVRIAGGTPTAAETNRIQDNVGTLLNEVAAVPILQGNAVRGVALPKATAVDIAHRLGRPWVGYVITYQDQPTTIYVSSTANRDRFLTLTADLAAVNIDVLVW